jgi:GWxTD domain-containing protein
MKSVFAVIILLGYSMVIRGQTIDSSSLPAVTLSTFANESFSQDSARVDLYIAIPYSELNLIRIGEKYVAEYSLKVSITSIPNGDTIIHNSEERSVVVEANEWDRVRELGLERADAMQYRLTLGQGNTYTVNVIIRDNISGKHQSNTQLFHVKEISHASMGLSDILFYRNKSGQRITPLIGDDLSGLQSDESGMMLELYNAPQSYPYWIVAIIRDTNISGDEYYRSSQSVVTTGIRRQPIFLQLNAEDLWQGTYSVDVYLYSNPADTSLLTSSDLRKHALAWSTRTIRINELRGIPISNLSVDEAIEQLMYIAVGGAYDSLSRADTRAEKRKAITAFWKQMNPNPDNSYNRPMQVFYRRVEYANKNFREGQAGWRTDRGRIYIQFGEPTSIRNSSYEAGRRPTEVWEYYDLGYQFIFVDQYIVNNYRLVNTIPPRGMFYWQRE